MKRLWIILTLSSFRMTVTRSLRRSWTTWLLKRTRKRAEKAQLRRVLLQLELESQLLRCKELEQKHLVLLHRQRETEESEDFHRPQPLLGLPPKSLGRPPENLLE